MRRVVFACLLTLALIAAAPPNDSISDFVCSAGVAEPPSPVSDTPTSLMTTDAPAFAIATAMARPMRWRDLRAR